MTNLPAKTSKEHYYLFFHDIHERLEPGGRFYVVVISGLRQFIARAFEEVFGNHQKSSRAGSTRWRWPNAVDRPKVMRFSG